MEIKKIKEELEKAVEKITLYENALVKIRDEEGKVCEGYDMCHHRACTSSYNSWAIASAALERLTPVVADADTTEAIISDTIDFLTEWLQSDTCYLLEVDRFLRERLRR